MIPLKNAPEVENLPDDKLYDIVYIGDRNLKMFKYHHTLYIIDPDVQNAQESIKYFTIEDDVI